MHETVASNSAVPTALGGMRTSRHDAARRRVRSQAQTDAAQRLLHIGVFRNPIAQTRVLGGLRVEDAFVLSIGKLAAGQAKYYLDQAEGRVDVVESVGDGIEDYYARRGEARGEWIGAAARRARACAARSTGRRCGGCWPGCDPRDGSPLRSSSSRARVGGFDLTFSAPKSVSVLFGRRRRGAARAGAGGA